MKKIYMLVAGWSYQPPLVFAMDKNGEMEDFFCKKHQEVANTSQNLGDGVKGSEEKKNDVLFNSSWFADWLENRECDYDRGVYKQLILIDRIY